ncbi:hypothetical protein CXB77_18160 [Chromatium okenii]|uniref:Calx-beta domain-containing protein n=2 Tax=Chromatium okenii TaxID=61644 RepID=A0A2S7XM93_9GAMM|nr:hypothetical protein CXB77_18160 [Chromatium okenii]
MTATRVTSTEGELAAITVTLSAPSTQTVTVDYATKDGSAKSINGDYVATTGSLTFAPSETSQTIILEPLDDTAVEQNETFLVQLSKSGECDLGDSHQRTVIILDDTQQCVALRRTTT